MTTKTIRPKNVEMPLDIQFGAKQKKQDSDFEDKVQRVLDIVENNNNNDSNNDNSQIKDTSATTTATRLI